MKSFRRRGKRIRASDASLLFQFLWSRLFGVWFVFYTPFHLPFLLSTKWQLFLFQKHFISIYGLVTLLVSVAMTGLSAYLYIRYRYDHIKQVLHRQKLAKMILENQWYETKQVQSSSFFEDIPSGKTKEKISYFPKMYYRLEQGMLHILVEITLGKYQEQLLSLEKKLESGLYCELVTKEVCVKFFST